MAKAGDGTRLINKWWKRYEKLYHSLSLTSASEITDNYKLNKLEALIHELSHAATLSVPMNQLIGRKAVGIISSHVCRLPEVTQVVLECLTIAVERDVFHILSTGGEPVANRVFYGPRELIITDDGFRTLAERQGVSWEMLLAMEDAPMYYRISELAHLVFQWLNTDWVTNIGYRNVLTDELLKYPPPKTHNHMSGAYGDEWDRVFVTLSGNMYTNKELPDEITEAMGFGEFQGGRDRRRFPNTLWLEDEQLVLRLELK